MVHSAVMAMKQAVGVAIQHGDIREDAVALTPSISALNLLPYAWGILFMFFCVMPFLQQH